ncbi:MAG: DMT family transporter [Pseudomonadota bacterium]
MTGSIGAGAASVIMLLAGVGIPVMAALNGRLGTHLGNPTLAAAILFAVALVTALVLMALQGRQVALSGLGTASAPLYLGGLLVAAYVVSITTLGPRIGLGNAIFLVLLGQLLASAFIDHFGLFGVQQAALTPSRLLGLGLIATGVALARNA